MGRRITNLLESLRQITQVPTVYVDGGLYVAAMLFAYLQTQFGSDEAAKWMSPVTLFWTRLTVGGLATSAIALKMFRSSAWAEHQAEVKSGDTKQWKQIAPTVEVASQPESKT